MLKTLSCSVVIPTTGRSTLERAIESALAQEGVDVEVVVAVSGNAKVTVRSRDPRIKIVGPFGGGANGARQGGISACSLSAVALLDDDDEWSPRKLKAQLAVADHLKAGNWLISCEFITGLGERETRGDSGKEWQVIEDPAEYLFVRRHVLRQPHQLQSSTLIFPRTLADAVPFDSNIKLHQDWAWLLSLKRQVDRLVIVKLHEPLVKYGISEGPSMSRSSKWNDSLAWASTHLGSLSPRVRGDFAAAISANFARRSGQPLAVVRCLLWAVRNGCPGLASLVYVLTSIPRAAARGVTLSLRRWQSRGADHASMPAMKAGSSGIVEMRAPGAMSSAE
jgi:glycosyltransferase involved in cell wall biosynthesis